VLPEVARPQGALRPHAPRSACASARRYCYARAFHEYLGLGAGSDFERVIAYKPRAAELLRAALLRPSWKGERVSFSGVTDCYQPLERRFRLTRACLEVCAELRNPVSVITRSALVSRDADVLADLARHQASFVIFSIPILDADLCRALEPGAPPPTLRLKAMRALADAGVPVGLSLSPVIPGLNDRLIPDTLRAARDAGASFAFHMLLRLSPSVAPVFERRLRERLPLRADAVMAKLRRARDGALNGPLGERGRGFDEASRTTHALFRMWHEKLGFGPAPKVPEPSPFRRPGRGVQLGLFG
jgi:DNA repair photolyase